MTGVSLWLEAVMKANVSEIIDGRMIEREIEHYGLTAEKCMCGEDLEVERSGAGWERAECYKGCAKTFNVRMVKQ